MEFGVDYDINVNMNNFDTKLVNLTDDTMRKDIISGSSSEPLPCSPSSVQLELQNLNEDIEQQQDQQQYKPKRTLTYSSSCSSEINTILDSFNEILDNADKNLDYEIHDLQLNDEKSRDFIVKSMENLNDLLLLESNDKDSGNNNNNKKVKFNIIDDDNEINNSNEELLIIVETESSSSSSADESSSETEESSRLQTTGSCLSNEGKGSSEQHLISDPEPDLDDPYPSLGGGSEVEEESCADHEEGYESDRPMMGRASMRKLRPIQILPMIPSSSSSTTVSTPGETHNSSKSSAPASSSSLSSTLDNKNGNEVLPPPSAGLATTLNSPVTNIILVTSLINNVLESPSSGLELGSEFSSSNDNVQNNIAASGGNGNESQNLFHGNANGEMNRRESSGSSSPEETITSVPGGISTRLNNTETSATVTNSMGSNLTSTASPNNEAIVNSSSTNSTTTTSPPICGSNSSQATASAATATTTPGSGSRTTVIRHANRTITIPPDNDDENEDRNNATAASSRRTSRSASNGQWPHRLSSVLALLGCTLGLNNICRFSLLSVQYGANFTIQFLILSCIIGIPLFTFHMSIGQYLNAGIIDMWKISPIFQGIGIGLIISQAMIGIYSAVGVSWMFIYFRDSFITKFDQYRWGKCFHDYRGCDPFSNATLSLAETVPDYFNGVVLQRETPDFPTTDYFPTSLKFTVTFNLAVVWMLVFVSLSKGLKSYGKVIHGFVLIPVVAVLILASKMVGIVPTDDTGSLFGQTEWTNFFFNSQTWVLAAREAFFTWGVLGACIMQITSHNKFDHSLKSDASIVILITTFVLFLSAFIGNACYSILLAQDYIYVPSSFESLKTYNFLVRKPPELPNMPILPSYMNQHTSFLMGVRIVKPDSNMFTVDKHFLNPGNAASGYQALRVATELYPTTMAILGSQGISPFWTVLFYFTFILFGIAQQLAIWHCLIKGVIAINAKTLKSWETTITFFVCLIGFGLGLPLCTEFGIFIIYFLDYCIGSGWWIMVLYLLELVAVFVVRGAPYCGENIITVFMTGNGQCTKCFAPLLSFVWNVILPVTMLVLSIASFKSGNVRELYDWGFSAVAEYIYWPGWAKELGSFIQLAPILMIPCAAIVQSCRYLTNGPSDLFDRMQQLYRPNTRGLAPHHFLGGLGRNRASNENGNNNQNGVAEDPPPKYTPPPSYSTATSARIAKFLRASIRRSLRRLSNPASSTENLPPPPNYASVILEINNSQQNSNACYSTNTTVPGNQSTSTQTQMSNANDNLLPILLPLTSALSSSSATNNGTGEAVQLTSSLTSSNEKQEVEKAEAQKSILDNNSFLQVHNQKSEYGHEFDRSSLRRIASDITPCDVARILRATFQKDSKNSRFETESSKVTGPAASAAAMNSSPENINGHQQHNIPNNIKDHLFDRHLSIESDQFYPVSNNSDNNKSTFLSTHCRTSSFPRSNFYNNFVDFSRCSRRSNDSQIALILNPSRRESLASDILSNEEFLSCSSTQEGIVNPTFQLNCNDSLSGSSTTIKTAVDVPIAGTSRSSLSSHVLNSNSSTLTGNKNTAMIPSSSTTLSNNDHMRSNTNEE